MGLRNLIETQIKKGMSQRILAQRIGVSHGTINNILAGIIPTRTTTLDKFAEFFHVSVEALRHDGGSHVAEPPAPYATPTKVVGLFVAASGNGVSGDTRALTAVFGQDGKMISRTWAQGRIGNSSSPEPLNADGTRPPRYDPTSAGAQ